MSNDMKLIPELRFPEFKSNGSWKASKIGSFAKVSAGGTPSSNEPKYWGGEIPWMNSGELNLKRVYDVENRITELGLKESSTKKIPSLCVLIGLAGQGKTRGTAAINYIELCTNQSIAAIHPNQSKFDSEFLFQKVDSLYQKLRRLSTGQGGRGGLNLTIIREIQIPLPSLDEQQKIASCLSTLDELIAAHNDKLDALKDHKKGLLQNLFPQEGETVPKVRFPEFTEPLQHSFYRDLGSIKIGLTHKPDYISSGIPFLSSKNISAGFIDFENIQYISQEKFDSMPDSTKPKVGDILFTRVGSNLGNPIILEHNIEFGIFVSLGFFRVNKKANNRYIKHWMESDYFWKQVNQKVAGGAKNNLNSTWLKEFELYIPSIKEQEKIATTLDSVDELIRAQIEKIEELNQHKRGLMQGLFPKIKS